MQRFVWIIITLALAACGASPAPQFFGAERHEITLEGYRFVVFHKDELAEVIRMNYLRRDQHGPVPRLMVAAVEQTTGCKVVGNEVGVVATLDTYTLRVEAVKRSPSLPGDTGEARFRLKC